MSFSSLFAYPTESTPAPIADQPFLTHWTHSQWQKLFALTQTYRYSVGDWVIRQGATDRAFYLVAFGRLEVVGNVGGKNNQRLALIEAGAIVGEQSFLDGRPQPLDVRAVTEAETVRLSFEAFAIFAAREPALTRDLALEIGRIVSLRLRAATGTG
ncbi:MAG: cyclic nucleotide-binding domain-containing protein [Caldilinea sp. CFX5]|nr:cyclic nucleotide-binding domain-containing protein [Caldilinea sp. CFX5]